MCNKMFDWPVAACYNIKMNEKFNILFGEMVLRSRLEKDISRDELAKVLKVSRVTVLRIEKGESGTSLALALAIAQYLNLSLDSLKNEGPSDLETFVTENYSSESERILEIIESV